MPARREADHAQAPGIDAPLVGFTADQSEGALGILEGTSSRLPLNIIGAARYAVLEEDAGDAEGIEPFGHLFAFQLPEQVPVTSARTDQHRSAGVLLLGRPINGDGWLGDVGYQA